MPVPPKFNEEFLQWFRAKTEMSWRQLPPRRMGDFLAELKQEEEETGLGSAYRSDGGWHPAWRSAKWLNSLTDEEINTVEEQWYLRFPADYRLFYKMLHSTDRPGFVPSGDELDDEYPWPYTGLFYNWQKNPTGIQQAYEHILGGFAFDAIYNNERFWHPEWGEKPLTEEEAHERLKPILDAAPRLIPLADHAYLLAEPCQAGNPVLSIWQSDIIVSAPDLRTYLLGSFGNLRNDLSHSLLQLSNRDRKRVNKEIKSLMDKKEHEYQAIPFWGDYLFF
ncbi:MAG TPA: hypothetical protein VGT82_04760 [Ktedonobacteraceae bacterium]|nr:hypothetical protein [Ktedonobacteraceae bacterium]